MRVHRGWNQLSLLIPCAWLSCLLRQKSFQTRPGVLQANKQRLASNEQFFENSSCPRCSFVVKYLSRSSISLSSQIRIFILSSPFKKNNFGQNFKNESWQEIAVGQNFYSFYAEASRKCNNKKWFDSKLSTDKVPSTFLADKRITTVNMWPTWVLGSLLTYLTIAL